MEFIIVNIATLLENGRQCLHAAKNLYQLPYNLKKHCDVTYIVLLRGKKYATKPPHAKDL